MSGLVFILVSLLLMSGMVFILVSPYLSGAVGDVQELPAG